MGKKKPKGKVRAAGIVLFTQTEPREFLLMRHVERWDLPKGHCERKETYLETALRETEEETGIPASEIAIDPDFKFKIKYPVQYERWGDEVFKKKVCYFIGYLESKPELVLTEHESAQWWTWDPPHAIQEQTIDPLLAEIAMHFDSAQE